MNYRELTAKDLISNLMQNSPDLIFFKDIEGKFLLISNSYSSFLGLSSPDDAIGKTSEEILSPTSAAKHRGEDYLIIKTARPIINQEEKEYTTDGKELISISSKMPVFDKERNVIGVFGISRNITRQKTLERDLRKLSIIDGLTLIPNRRRFDELIEHEWNSCSRSRKPISMLMIDIDDFKLYNDAFGHIAGDKCLKDVAGAISSSLERKTDFCARYGGEEFTVLLPQTDSDGAVLIAEKIHKTIRDLMIPNEESHISPILSVSIGIATAKPTPRIASHSLLLHADKAMYQAKKEGKNRTVCDDSI